MVVETCFQFLARAFKRGLTNKYPGGPPGGYPGFGQAFVEHDLWESCISAATKQIHGEIGPTNSALMEASRLFLQNHMVSAEFCTL
jgi:hypothetical protein